jgi:proteasome lid subunit RPN8/RPN11
VFSILAGKTVRRFTIRLTVSRVRGMEIGRRSTRILSGTPPKPSFSTSQKYTGSSTAEGIMAHNKSIKCSLWRWWCICRQLKKRGHGTRESGAFLLGKEIGSAKCISFAVYYDDIDPDALSSGIVRLRGGAMSEVWRICRENGLQVVADVHTHPGGAGQSNSDKKHPMVSMKGHVALILPQFAQAPFAFSRIGVYRYCGAKTWSSCPSPNLRWFTLWFEVMS